MQNNIKESSSLTVWVHRTLDLSIPLVTLVLTSLLYNNIWSDKYQILGVLGGLLLVIFSQGTGVYSQWRGRALLSGFRLVIQAWGLTWLALLAIGFLLKDSNQFSRVIIVGWAISTPALLFFYRLCIRYLLGLFRAKGINTSRVAIIGAGELGARLALTLTNAKMLGYVPVAFYDDDPLKINTSINNIPVKGNIHDFIAKKHFTDDFDEIYITLPMRSENRIKEVLNALADSTATVKFIPDCFAFDLLHSRLTDIGGIPIISVYDSPLNNFTNQFIKRSEDIILSVFILILISPLLVILSFGVKLTSPGPILYKQKRIGWNGKTFNIYKFRSMPIDTDKSGIKWGSAQSKINSKFGAFLRKNSLDELPQFLNTLVGNMSIVGPRPERDIFVEKFRNEIPRYMQKHMVKAGITGWAQINGWRGDTSIEKRVQYDLYYIDNWSIWLDIKIIFLTIVKGFINKNAY